MKRKKLRRNDYEAPKPQRIGKEEVVEEIQRIMKEAATRLINTVFDVQSPDDPDNWDNFQETLTSTLFDMSEVAAYLYKRQWEASRMIEKLAVHLAEDEEIHPAWLPENNERLD